MRKKMFSLAMALLAILFVSAQVTTGTITGVVTGNKGESLAGATVTAVHTPTGAKYVTVAKKSGGFTIPNVKVGGPYQVTVSFSGYKESVYNDLDVSLGTPLNITVAMTTTSGDLKEVTITAQGKGSIISSQRNGTSTFISNRQIQALPSVNRNVQDFARLTPQVKAGSGGPDGNGTGLSFAGQSNRYNQFSIDGSNASDAFGLGSTGTNGGQANVNPISMEAIQELQVILSPYDVTQGGFTGGGINAVTKSGTNKIHGSLYGQYQNDGFVGKSIRYNDVLKASPRASYPTFKNQTFGASLGGPIIKNKLFFFAAVEMFRKALPVAFDPTDPTSGSKVNVSSLQKIRDFMQKTYGYDLGGFGAISNENKSNSVFARIDWNISDKHKLTLRHNYVDGSNQIRSRSALTPLFENTGYQFTDKANSTVLELNSSFNSSTSNVLRVTYNAIRDARISNAAPNLTIINTETDATDATKKVSVTYNLGSDFSSAANSLNQNILSVTDNFTLYKGNHTMTFGTSNEFFKSDNVFLQGFYGGYTYNAGAAVDNVANWEANTGMTAYSIGYSAAGRGDRAVATLKSAQLSLYAQDVWAANPYFKLTYGMRVDLPYITTKPVENTVFNTDFAAQGVATNLMPKRQLMYSPRVGFNWDVEKNGQLQVRGGVGLFTGRVPFVWISNQLSNTGIATKNLTYGTTGASTIASNNITYVFNKADPQLGAFIPAAGTAAAPTINVIDKNFKFPQVFRANLAFDRKLGGGFVATMEGVFTKNINNGSYTNLNIAPTGGTVKLGPTTRPLYGASYVDSKFAQVIELSNTSAGYAFNLTGQIQKTYSQGWAGSIAYTYGTSSSLNDLPSSVALSNWRGTQVVNGLNAPTLTRSNFDMGSRITGYISKEFRYAKNLATTITLFYNGQSGQALSYVYASAGSRNLTGDDIGGSATSMVYIPASLSEANFVDITGGATASQQWADFQAFAKSNNYLGKNMGSNAERNADRLPFESHFDLRLAQDFKLKGYKLQIFVDVLNLGALVNEKYGRSYGTGSYPDGFFPTTVNLFTPVYSGAQKQDGVAITPTTANPAFQFNIGNFTKIGNDYKAYNINNFTSRWNAQIGARFTF